MGIRCGWGSRVGGLVCGLCRHSLHEPETSDIQPKRFVTTSRKFTLLRGETTVPDVNQFWSGMHCLQYRANGGSPQLGHGPHTIFAIFGIVIFAVATRWHKAFGIFGVCSLLTCLFYGWIWLLERDANRDYQERFGDLGIKPSDHIPRGLHSIVLYFETQFLSVVWVVGLLLFLRSLISSLDER